MPRADPKRGRQDSEECIEAVEQRVAGPSRPRQPVTPTKSTTTTTTATVEISAKKSHYSSLLPLPSARKRRLPDVLSPAPSSGPTTPEKRAPLTTASPTVNRSRTPLTPSRSTKGKEKATPSNGTVKKSAGGSKSSALKTTRNNEPSPSKRSRRISPAKQPSPSPIVDPGEVDYEEEEEITVDENGYIRLPPKPVSRETFLANEKLRRQREARNFKYEGSADAPKLTRSGRVIGRVDSVETEMTDDNPFLDHPTPALSAADNVEDDQDIVRRQEEEMEDTDDNQDVIPLPFGAEAYVRRIMNTFTGRRIAFDPPPFAHEEGNEVLKGLVNLLKGTVERGEGNSALLTGARGVGKTRTVARALQLLPVTSAASPIVVRLSGLAQTNDRLAIREMGRQIAEAEGRMIAETEEDDEVAEDAEYAPTTLPSHLLALLTAPSPRAIIIIIDEFDLFTEHARQALLYCLLDVVQSVKTGPVETTGRGIAVIGLTSRVDTLLLLEKRVKSRFSHRMWRVISPLSHDGMGWKELLLRAIVPWQFEERVEDDEAYPDLPGWKEVWEFAITTLLENDRVVKNVERLVGLTTDVRILYRPFIPPIASILTGQSDFISVSEIHSSIISQLESASWGLANKKLKGLPHPSIGVLIILKHLFYLGREEVTFTMVQEEYQKFGRTKLVGSGRTRWPADILRGGFDHLIKLGLLSPAGTGNVRPQFAKFRCTLSAHDIVAWMKGDAAVGLGPEMVSWGRMTSAHL